MGVGECSWGRYVGCGPFVCVDCLPCVAVDASCCLWDGRRLVWYLGRLSE